MNSFIEYDWLGLSSSLHFISLLKVETLITAFLCSVFSNTFRSVTSQFHCNIITQQYRLTYSSVSDLAISGQSTQDSGGSGLPPRGLATHGPGHFRDYVPFRAFPGNGYSKQDCLTPLGITAQTLSEDARSAEAFGSDFCFRSFIQQAISHLHCSQSLNTSMLLQPACKISARITFGHCWNALLTISGLVSRQGNNDQCYVA